jgi:hypothetical protein
MFRFPFLIRRCSYLVNLQLVGGGAVNEECFWIRTPLDFGRVVERDVAADALVLLVHKVLGEPRVDFLKGQISREEIK